MQIKEAALEDYPFKNHWAAFGFAGPVRYYLWIIGKCMHSFVGMWRGNKIFHFYMFSIIFNNILHVFNNPFVFWPCKVSHCCKRTATRQHLKTITHYFSFKNQRTIASLKASPGPITIGTLNCPPSDELVWWSIKRSDHGDQSINLPSFAIFKLCLERRTSSQWWWWWGWQSWWQWCWGDQSCLINNLQTLPWK